MMNAKGGKRVIVSENGDKVDTGMSGIDDSALASAIGNGEDLGPFIRAAFESGKPESLVHQLRNFVKKKEVEIEDLCKAHYEEFIQAVDELRYVLVDADELKGGLAEENSRLQDVGNTFLAKLDALIESHGTKQNLAHAIESLRICTTVLDLCLKVNEDIMTDSYYPALKSLDILERDYLSRIPAKAFRLLLEKEIPICRNHIERKVSAEFNEWLVQIRSIAREIGQRSIGQASSARIREEDLRGGQRQAEEQSRSGSRECVYMLEMEDLEEDDSQLKFDLTPVYRAYHINTCLGLDEQFKEYYYKNRQLQLISDLQASSAQGFLETHQTYFAQIAGFFIVEDRVLRSAGGLITNARVESLWETAISKMNVVIEDQFSRMQTANHLLLVKDYVSLLGVTLRRYGFQVGPLLDVLDTMRDKYHELLLNDCRKRVTDDLAADKYEQMVMRKEYEYQTNVLMFNLQTSDVMPAFPYVAPFSASVPDCCRAVKDFIEFSVNFLSYGGHMDFYDLVKKYIDKLIITVLNEALLKLIQNPMLGVSHAMQIAANMTVLERACSFFSEYAAKLCGIPMRLVDGPHGTLSGRAVLRQSQAVAHEQMLKLVKSKVDEFMLLTGNINWTPDDPPLSGNEYLNDVTIYLETLAETAQEILPLDAFDKMIRGVLTHISESIVGTLYGDDVKKFNINAMMGIDADLKVLESFADDKFQSSGLDQLPGSSNLRTCLAEARQLVNLFIASNPELFLNPVIREKNYSALDARKVQRVAEKYRDLPERFSLGRPRHPGKKKSLDALCRRLRDQL
ncbi:exocyst complex component 6 [Marchantia polymorpha subsp. ruderalis]|uniref:Exocyst complex component n=2 Tax=Marchantia polymorpha TaxID=3197 RepID=A0AAF6AMN4_MARPO|nr:hypothetical protein MARPO_0036s0016 [Marchantia polymorpha]BBM97704.1 hypothetical protein Mp_1g07700 [Marchantia polymorpha subsp. ruderalis]|eukprot:PTQ41009.1 hypothetical protein MARPO_0036s0016 [Marchantia polymorpha]